jgi:hypothetical protein
MQRHYQARSKDPLKTTNMFEALSSFSEEEEEEEEEEERPKPPTLKDDDVQDRREPVRSNSFRRSEVMNSKKNHAGRSNASKNVDFFFWGKKIEGVSSISDKNKKHKKCVVSFCDSNIRKTYGEILCKKRDIFKKYVSRSERAMLFGSDEDTSSVMSDNAKFVKGDRFMGIENRFTYDRSNYRLSYFYRCHGERRFFLFSFKTEKKVSSSVEIGKYRVTTPDC